METSLRPCRRVFLQNLSSTDKREGTGRGRVCFYGAVTRVNDRFISYKLLRGVFYDLVELLLVDGTINDVHEKIDMQAVESALKNTLWENTNKSRGKTCYTMSFYV